jgi:phospholipase C
VCDHWFSSIPGPTLPNRLFAHCGTSRGRLEMAPEYYAGFYTVYEELAKHEVPSCIFWSDWSGTLTFSGLMAHENLFYEDYENFAAICAGPADQVPAYCFIEPRYNPAKLPTGGALPANDQHPDNDIRDGETLIKNVYNAIRQTDELWHSSVLLIVYDEHGGLYDHVKPVPLPSPDRLSSVNPPFDFTMSGLRVPAVLVSPYIRPGTISKKIFDHTSTIATALKLFTDSWPSDALFERAKAANTFDDVLDLSMQPRDEWPNFAAPAHGPSPNLATGQPLSDLQRQSVEHAISLNKSLPPPKQIAVPGDVFTDSAAAGSFTKAVGNAALAAHEDIKI